MSILPVDSRMQIPNKQLDCTESEKIIISGAISTTTHAQPILAASKRIPHQTSKIREVLEKTIPTRAENVELIRHIPEDFSLPSFSEKQIEAVAQALIQSDFTHEIFKDKYLSHILFAAHQKGYLSTAQFTTGIFLAEAISDFGYDSVKVLPIDGNEGMLGQSLFLDSYRARLDQAESHDFLSTITSLPNSEKIGILIDLPKKPKELFEGLRLLHSVFAPCQIFYSSHQPVLFVPSFSILKAFLYAAHGENAVEIYPALGKISAKYIQEELDRRHVVNLNLLPSSFALDKADGYKMGHLGFSMHDLYHAFRLSSIPICHRRAFQKIYLVIEETLKNWKGYPTELKKGYYTNFADQDFSCYDVVWYYKKYVTSQKSLSRADHTFISRMKIFHPYWNADNHIFQITKRTKVLSKSQKASLDMEAFSDHLIHFLYKLNESIPKTLFDHTAHSVFKALAGWKKDLGIDLHHINWNLDCPLLIEKDSGLPESFLISLRNISLVYSQ